MGEAVNDPAEVAAQALADGKIVGWFKGRMEFGPRALGARSILADPRIKDIRERINRRVKFSFNTMESLSWTTCCHPSPKS